MRNLIAAAKSRLSIRRKWVIVGVLLLPIQWLASPRLSIWLIYCIFVLSVFLFSNIIFKYFVQTLSLIGASAILAPVVLPTDIAEAVFKILKIGSLGLIAVEGYRGLGRARGLNQSIPVQIFKLAEVGVYLCIIAIVALTAFLFKPELLKSPLHTLCVVTGIDVDREMAYLYSVSTISLLPILWYCGTNLFVTNHHAIARDGNVHETHSQYLHLINIPSVVCMLTIFAIGLLLHWFGIEQKVITAMVSGSVTLLIFVALLITCYIEEEAQRRQPS